MTKFALVFAVAASLALGSCGPSAEAPADSTLVSAEFAEIDRADDADSEVSSDEAATGPEDGTYTKTCSYDVSENAFVTCRCAYNRYASYVRYSPAAARRNHAWFHDGVAFYMYASGNYSVRLELTCHF